MSLLVVIGTLLPLIEDHKDDAGSPAALITMLGLVFAISGFATSGVNMPTVSTRTCEWKTQRRTTIKNTDELLTARPPLKQEGKLCVFLLLHQPNPIFFTVPSLLSTSPHARLGVPSFAQFTPLELVIDSTIVTHQSTCNCGFPAAAAAASNQRREDLPTRVLPFRSRSRCHFSFVRQLRHVQRGREKNYPEHNARRVIVARWRGGAFIRSDSEKF